MLKSLELFGFKSFADRTRFDFAPGITAVVGPNGSGKSNVVDAIKWILGDQSPKSLRGKDMTDVIFNGAAGRKPAGFAEATLTFDNGKRVLQLDADEVQIGRRIYRSGEAEYLINRTPARLKDVKDLFLGTGAGSSAYSIIEQGRVDLLLQASTVARRNVFEEAAGISRFRAKKTEAQRKLERVAQNLLRLTDIVKEVETQLNTVRSQASKAAKFRELSQELKTLWLGLAADDYRSITRQLEQIDNERGTLQADLDVASEAARESEAQQQSSESRFSEVEDRLRAAERREAESREAIAGHEVTLRHQTARKQELEADAVRLDQQQGELTARVQAVAGELEQTVDHLERFAEEFEKRQQDLRELERQIQDQGAQTDADRELIENGRKRLLEEVRQTSLLESRLATLSSQVATLRAAREQAATRIESLTDDLGSLEAEGAQRRELLESALGGLETLRDEWQATQSRRHELFAQQAESRQQLVETREQRSAVQARKSLLEDLELRQEGLGVGVKEILSRSRERDPQPPWDQVRGHVADLLEVDIENAALVEVALGSRAQLIVLDDNRPLLEFLNRGDCPISGRVGFLMRWSDRFAPGDLADPAARLPDFSGLPGVVNRADRLVRPAASQPRLAEQLMADTWIVMTLAVAQLLHEESGGRCRFVTLQGELLDHDGTLYAGLVRSESSLVSRRSELRGIKFDLQRLDTRIESEEATLERLAVELQQLDAHSIDVQQSLDEATHKIAELKSVVGARELEIDRLMRERSRVEEEMVRNLEEEERLEPLREQTQVELRKIEIEAHVAQQEIEEAEKRIASCEQEQQEMHARFAAEQMDLAKYEERFRNLQQARTRLDQERFQRDLHREEAERRFAHIASKRDQIEIEIQKSQNALDELNASKEVLVAETARLQAERDSARRLRAEMSEQELRLRHRARDLKERMHGLEMKSSEFRHQLTNLQERLRDEYQLELAELAATDVSARRTWLESQRPATEAEIPASSEGEDITLESTDAESDIELPAVDDDAVIRAQIEERINRCRRKVKQLGTVNADSLQELDDLETRYARLSSQLQDLVEAKNTLEEIIRRINNESRRLFSDTFNEIRENFQDLFRKLFGGGEGDVILENPEDILECGIDVVARPPGKELRSISLLSGGEKTMTAVALLLAIFKSKPSPFCILDEVDAALDEGNVNRYTNVLKDFQTFTQFIIVTHHKRTMAGADVLYGVTMEEAGVSKRMSVRFDDISDDGHIRKGAVEVPTPGEEANATNAA